MEQTDTLQSENIHEPVTEDGVVFCTVHPTVETSLRCNKCGRPMCTKCAVRTPVGYRCKDCIRGQQKVFYNAKAIDPVIQLGISFGLSAVAAFVLANFVGGFLGFFSWIIAFVAGSAIGGGIANLAHRAVGKRRGRYSWLIVAAGIVAGALLSLLFSSRGFLVLGIYGFTAVSAAIGMLRFSR